MNKPIRGLIWDLDHSLYDHTPMLPDWKRAAAQTAVDLKAVHHFECAHSLAQLSWDVHGNSSQIFIDKFGMSFEDMHLGTHAGLDPTLIDPSQLTGTTRNVMGGFKHALITHSSRYWGLRSLERLGISEHFADNSIFGLETLHYHRKNRSPLPVYAALTTLGLCASEVLFVEDTADNLIIPHQLGLKTALIHREASKRIKPAHVDWLCTDANDVMQIAEAHNRNRRTYASQKTLVR